MRDRRRLLLLLLPLGAALGMAWCLGSRLFLTRPSNGAAAATSAVEIPFPPPFRAGTPATETAWIATEIARDIVETLAFGKDRSVLPADALEIGVEQSRSGSSSLTVSSKAGPSLSARMALEPHPWSPDAYANLVRASVDSLGLPLQDGAGAGDSSLPEILLVPRADVIQELNVRISHRLSEAPLDPRAHEDAALLLGVFALRESSGGFQDTRAALSRMASHLALAEGLRGSRPGGLAAVLGRAVLSGLAGRTKEAQDAVDAFRRQATTEPERAWARALTLRNTGDWTTLPRPESATLLERLEFLRAIKGSLGPTRSNESLRGLWKEPLPDWGRISLAGDMSLEDGHMFVDPSHPMERLDLEEMRLVFPELSAKPTASDLAAVLNREPSRLVSRGSTVASIRVISSGLWGQFFQRHLLGRAGSSAIWLRTKLAVPDEARAYEALVASAFGGLRLFPALPLHLSWIGGDEPGKKAAGAVATLVPSCRALVALAIVEPGILNARTRRPLETRCPNEAAAAGMPDAMAWFRPGIPWGTAYDAAERIQFPNVRRWYDTSSSEWLWRLNPFDREVAALYLEKKLGRSPTPEEFAATYGPLVEYDLVSMARYRDLQKDRPEQYRKTFERMCALNPNEYFQLGEYLADQDLEAEAVAAYENGQRLATPVAVANGIRWLVNYYFDRRQSDRALALAQEAGETYSGTGLETLARLYERLRDPVKAEECWRKIVERYGRDEGLRKFYARQAIRGGDGRFGDKPRAALEQFFPGGMARITTGPPPAVPAGGMALTKVGSKLERCGLRPGDVIVGVDGYRIENGDQFEIVRLLNQDPAIRFIVRRGESYVELSGRFTGRILIGIATQ